MSKHNSLSIFKLVKENEINEDDTNMNLTKSKIKKVEKLNEVQ